MSHDHMLQLIDKEIEEVFEEFKECPHKEGLEILSTLLMCKKDILKIEILEKETRKEKLHS